MEFVGFTLRNNLFVAPMAGVTDRPFRQLCKTMGAGLAVSEMVTSNSLLYGSAKTLRRANHEGEVAPISVQIAGADPAMMAEAAELVCKAEELRGKAYFAGCSLEGQAKGHWSMEAVEQAKRRAGW